MSSTGSRKLVSPQLSRPSPGDRSKRTAESVNEITSPKLALSQRYGVVGGELERTEGYISFPLPASR